MLSCVACLWWWSWLAGSRQGRALAPRAPRARQKQAWQQWQHRRTRSAACCCRKQGPAVEALVRADVGAEPRKTARHSQKSRWCGWSAPAARESQAHGLQQKPPRTERLAVRLDRCQSCRTGRCRGVSTVSPALPVLTVAGLFAALCNRKYVSHIQTTGPCFYAAHHPRPGRFCPSQVVSGITPSPIHNRTNRDALRGRLQARFSRGGCMSLLRRLKEQAVTPDCPCILHLGLVGKPPWALACGVLFCFRATWQGDLESLWHAIVPAGGAS